MLFSRPVEKSTLSHHEGCYLSLFSLIKICLENRTGKMGDLLRQKESEKIPDTVSHRTREDSRFHRKLDLVVHAEGSAPAKRYQLRSRSLS